MDDSPTFSPRRSQRLRDKVAAAAADKNVNREDSKKTLTAVTTSVPKKNKLTGKVTYTSSIRSQMVTANDHRSVTSDLFSRIPDEIIVKSILPHIDLSDLLTKISLVNQRFRILCLDKSLWTQLDLKLGESIGLDYNAAIRVINRAPMLRVLSVCSPEEHDDQHGDHTMVAIYAVKNCLQLEEIGVCLNSTFTANELLRAIGSHGKALRWLGLQQTSSDIMLDWKNIAQNVIYLKNLTHLTVQMPLSPVFLNAIADYCRNLQHFDDRQYWVCEDSLIDTMDYLLDKVQHTLRYLQISADFVNNGKMRNLDKCIHLKELHLPNISSFEAEELYSISELKELTHLELMNLTNVSRADLFLVIGQQKLQNLTHLEIGRMIQVDDDFLRMIADNCPKLSEFILKYSIRFDENPLFPIEFKKGQKRNIFANWGQLDLGRVERMSIIGHGKVSNLMFKLLAGKVTFWKNRWYAEDNWGLDWLTVDIRATTNS